MPNIKTNEQELAGKVAQWFIEQNIWELNQ